MNASNSKKISNSDISYSDMSSDYVDDGNNQTLLELNMKKSTVKSQLLQEYVDTVMEENEETPKNTPDSDE